MRGTGRGSGLGMKYLIQPLLKKAVQTVEHAWPGAGVFVTPFSAANDGSDALRVSWRREPPERSRQMWEAAAREIATARHCSFAKSREQRRPANVVWHYSEEGGAGSRRRIGIGATRRWGRACGLAGY